MARRPAHTDRSAPTNGIAPPLPDLASMLWHVQAANGTTHSIPPRPRQASPARAPRRRMNTPCSSPARRGFDAFNERTMSARRSPALTHGQAIAAGAMTDPQPHHPTPITIRQARATAGLTQTEVACTVRGWQQWEAGHRARPVAPQRPRVRQAVTPNTPNAFMAGHTARQTPRLFCADSTDASIGRPWSADAKQHTNPTQTTWQASRLMGIRTL